MHFRFIIYGLCTTVCVLWIIFTNGTWRYDVFSFFTSHENDLYGLFRQFTKGSVHYLQQGLVPKKLGLKPKQMWPNLFFPSTEPSYKPSFKIFIIRGFHLAVFEQINSMFYHFYCNFRRNIDLFCFFVYVQKFVTQYYFHDKKNVPNLLLPKNCLTQSISLRYQLLT